MSDKTALAKRMKENYEMRSRQYLTRRLPTLIRLDGKAFHTYTAGLDKPFDEGLIEDMQLTTAFLCEEIQGVKCGYTQSDEITLLLTDYDTITTDAWFDYNVQKMASVAASLATAKFNQLRMMRASKKEEGFYINFLSTNDIGGFRLAFFDARIFQIPEHEEVVNCFIWRQRDAEKNSISMLAQSLFSQSELHGMKSNDMQEMCFQKGQNWNDLHFSKKRGSLIVKNIIVNGTLIEPEFIRNEIPSLYNEVGALWLDPNDVNGEYPNKKGRLREWRAVKTNEVFGTGVETFDPEEMETWVDTPIVSIRRKWGVVETPIFGQNRESILNLL